MVGPSGGIQYAPLTWGQLWPWLDRYRPPWARGFGNVEVSCPVPTPATVAAARTALRELLIRQVGLRTRIVLGDDGEPCQVVHEPEMVPVSVIELPVTNDVPAPGTSGTDDLATAERAFFSDSSTATDVTGGVTRAAILVRSGAARRVLLSVHHVALDLAGADLVAAEFSRLLTAVAQGRTVDLSPVRLTPLAQAAAQHSAGAVATSTAAMHFWERQLTSVPQTLFPQARPGAASRAVYRVNLRSPGAHLAAAALSRCLEAPIAAVHLAALAAVLSAGTGLQRIPIEVQSANRFGRDQAALVASLVLPAQTVIEIDPAQSFKALVGRTAHAMLVALRYGSGDHLRRMEGTVRVQHRRGVNFYAPVEFNYVRSTERLDRDVTAADVAAADGLGELEVESLHWFDRFHFGLAQRDGAACVQMYAPRRAFDAQRAVALVRGYESVLVRAVLDGDASVSSLTTAAGLRQPPLEDGWELVDHNLVRPDALRDLLAEHPAVSVAAVVVDRQADGARLRAHVEARDGAGLTPGGLHRWLVAELACHPAVAAPCWYTVYRTAPPVAQRDDGSAWSACPVTAQGDGRAREPLRPPADERERLLLELVVRYGATDVHLDDCYVEAGGALSRVPAILTRLAMAGWTGLDLRAFTSMKSLAELSRTLRPGPVPNWLDGREALAEGDG